MNLNNKLKQEPKELEQNKNKGEEIQNSNSTMQSSKVISKQKDVIENQKEQIDLLKAELDSKKEEILSLQKQKSESSSTISMLKKELQMKTEKIERLNSADLILKENERLKEDNQKLKRYSEETEEKCSNTILNFDLKCKRKQEELLNRINEVEAIKSDVATLKINIETEIQLVANELKEVESKRLKKEYDDSVADIKATYDRKRVAIYSVTLVSLFYGLVITILKLYSSVRIKGDIVKLTVIILKAFVGIVVINIELIKANWELIDENNVSPIFILVIIIGMLVIEFIFIFGVISYIVRYLSWAYKKHLFDSSMAITMLATLIILAWFADSLISVHWNLWFIWLMVQAVVLLARGFNKSFNNC